MHVASKNCVTFFALALRLTSVVCIIEIAEQMFIMIRFAVWPVCISSSTRVIRCSSNFGPGIAFGFFWIYCRVMSMNTFHQPAASLFITAQIYHELFSNRSKATNETYILLLSFGWLHALRFCFSSFDNFSAISIFRPR